jgi:hypothetical protein
MIKVGEDKSSPEISYHHDDKKNKSIKTPSKTCGYIYKKQTNQLCAEFHCEWEFQE